MIFYGNLLRAFKSTAAEIYSAITARSVREFIKFNSLKWVGDRSKSSNAKYRGKHGCVTQICVVTVLGNVVFSGRTITITIKTKSIRVNYLFCC